jgi:hypothetical protein
MVKQTGFMNQGLHITTEHNIRIITTAIFWDVEESGEKTI